jgi:hypothetical protein
MTSVILLLLSCGAIEIQTNEPALARVRRIYVDQLGGGRVSDQMQDMIVAAVQNTGLFVITENRERADAILKGSGDETIFHEVHATSDSIGFRAGGGASSSSAAQSARSSSRQTLSAGVTDSESSRSDERRREAVASVRLVDTQGDVIWSTTQESQGAKFRGSMSDVADKIARKLAEETQRARLETLRPHELKPGIQNAATPKPGAQAQ